MGLTYIFAWMVYFNFVTAFNIDKKNPYIYQPKNEKDTYFGYSIAFNSKLKSIVVGAPFSNHTNDGNKPWGSVFSCKYSETESSRVCKRLPRLDTMTFSREVKDNQMMGATVYSDNVRTLACAPRYKNRAKGKSDKMWLLGKCDLIYPEYVRDKDEVYMPCATLVDSLHEFGFCEAGISAKLNIQGTDMGIISGMPRAQLSKGLLGYGIGQDTKFTNESSLKISDYLGYAIGSGKFSVDVKDKVTQSIVGGAPRANLLTGRVLLYKITTGGFPQIGDIPDPSGRPGSYFGSSLAVTNIDNDDQKLDDLVVGAPFYSAGQQPNEGAVYVYLNLKVGDEQKMTLKQTIYGKKRKNACFGFSIGSVGDLNKDSNNDIVIGAPWGGEDGRGVVYVYYGTPNVHEPLKLKQTLIPKDINGGNDLNGFGFSFAEYYQYGKNDGKTLNDVDQNKYPDLGIGAYKSDSVVILRSRPVVTILGKLKIEDKDMKDFTEIDLFNRAKSSMCLYTDGKTYKCMVIKVSFTITGIGIQGENLGITYTLDVDANQKASKRGFFKDRSSVFTANLKVQSTADITHQRVTVFLVNNTKDIVREMVVKLSWVIDESKACSSNICPVANAMVYQLSIEKIAYIKGCSDDGNDVCNADLNLKLKSVTDIIKTGITDVLKIRATVTNKGENAFLNKLQIVYPLGIQPNKVKIKDFPGTVIWDPNVSLDKQNVYTLQVDLSNRIDQDQVEIVDIEFGVDNLPSSKREVKLTGIVKTESEDNKTADNADEVSVKVVLVANLTITGNALPEMVRWNKDHTSITTRGPKITHTFLLQNGGPSDIDDGKVLINFPEKINNMYILNIVDFKLESSKTSQIMPTCSFGDLNPINLNKSLLADIVYTSASTSKNGTKTRRRRGVDTPLDCDDSDVQCRVITCPRVHLKKSGDVSIKITSTLVEATFEKYIKENRKLSVYAKFTSSTVGKPDKDPAKDDVEVSLIVISPHQTKRADSKPLAWWIILLCILAALIIILGVVAILYKKGFFTRNRPQEEEEKLKNGYDEEEEEE